MESILNADINPYVGSTIYVNAFIDSPKVKKFRKYYDLPITKPIVCFDVAIEHKSPHIVQEIMVAKHYRGNSSKLFVTLDNGQEFFILSDFLSEMQKSNFIVTYFK